jgi:malonyl CoA-acyl carrier protein transacylase
MLTDWLELPGAEPFFRWAGGIAGADLLTLGTTGDAEAIKDTAVTQPLVVAMSLFVAGELGALPELGAPADGHVVAAGALEGLEALKADPPAKARIMPLSVAGAFHTSFMASARDELEARVDGLTPADPSRRLLSNTDGTAVDSGAEVVRRLVSQVTSPVRFDSCLATMRELGVTAVLELPPAGALAGLAKREWKGTDIEILAVTGPKDLDRARELLGGRA